MAFIKLTKKDGCSLIVNLDRVCSIDEVKGGFNVIFDVLDKELNTYGELPLYYECVKENADEILELIAKAKN